MVGERKEHRGSETIITFNSSEEEQMEVNLGI